jgi:hypothetical protein
MLENDLLLDLRRGLRCSRIRRRSQMWAPPAARATTGQHNGIRIVGLKSPPGPEKLLYLFRESLI